MADDSRPDLRPLRTGRYYTEAEIAEHARRAADRARRDYPTRGKLAEALGVPGSALSAALAYGDPSRPDYPRGKSVRRAVLRLLVGFEFNEEASYAAVEPAPERGSTDPETP